MEAHVPLFDLPRLWSKPAAHYLAATGIGDGWGWVWLVHKADMLNLVGIAILSGCSIFALLVVTLLYIRQRHRLVAALCGIEIMVIVLAASDLLSGSR